MKERHLVALSGGKDSAALAVYMRENYRNLEMEYVFIDSGCELPETYEYLERLKAILGISIAVVKSRRNFEYWLKVFKGVLPAPSNRWCTRLLKLDPYAEWLRKECANSIVYNYAGLRADEAREGYKPKSDRVTSIFPFVNDGLVLSDIKQILEESGIGLPDYYSWRQRSGCFFCFYQRDNEWRGLRKFHPDLFEKSCRLEEQHEDGRSYTWRDSGPLRNLSEVSNLLPPERAFGRSTLSENLTRVVDGEIRTGCFLKKGGYLDGKDN